MSRATNTSSQFLQHYVSQKWLLSTSQVSRCYTQIIRKWGGRILLKFFMALLQKRSDVLQRWFTYSKCYILFEKLLALWFSLLFYVFTKYFQYVIIFFGLAAERHKPDARRRAPGCCMDRRQLCSCSAERLRRLLSRGRWTLHYASYFIIQIRREYGMWTRLFFDQRVLQGNTGSFREIPFLISITLNEKSILKKKFQVSKSLRFPVCCFSRWLPKKFLASTNLYLSIDVNHFQFDLPILTLWFVEFHSFPSAFDRVFSRNVSAFQRGGSKFIEAELPGETIIYSHIFHIFTHTYSPTQNKKFIAICF